MSRDSSSGCLNLAEELGSLKLKSPQPHLVKSCNSKKLQQTRFVTMDKVSGSQVQHVS